jgi:hypothetical protein
MKRSLTAVLCLLSVLLPLAQASAGGRMPIFDAHIHYNLDEGRPLPVDQVFALWREAGILGGILTSRPNDGTRELLAAAPEEFRNVAFARPYEKLQDVQTWFRDPAIFSMIERELARGIYVGIGEFHIFGRDADGEDFARWVRLAAREGLWLHAHCDDDVIARIYALDPAARVIWAHTGMGIPAPRVDELFDRHPALYGELSFRSGIESDAWRALFLKYPDRFMLGSDTWVPTRWPEVPAIMQRYRNWLAGLPEDVAERIAWRNGARLFLGQ